MKFKKITAYMCAAMISLSAINPVYADTAPYVLPSDPDSDDENVEETIDLTAESAVNYGLEHNKSIEILENKIQLAIIASSNANKNSSDLKKAKDTLKDAMNEIDDKKQKLNQAQAALNAGINIGLTQEYIDNSRMALKEAETTIELKQEEFKAILGDTSEKLDTKINYGTVINLDAKDAGELMITMAGVNLDVTRYAKNIYKNQIAMLIQKNYYDSLYAKKVYELKKIAMERGEKQYNIVKLSYDNGMKAKDDLLLSKMYYDGTIIACHLAESNYKNSFTELKENMNLNINAEITLEDSMLNDVTEESLESAMKSGLTNRIEIQQALGQLKIYELNEDIINSRAEYKAHKNGIKEAKLLKEGAKLQLDKTKTSVKSEINQSYETMVAAGEMLKASNELVKNAEEVVRIANLKYQQGFGAENALLKEMNLQESSGTIIELIAAQEKLSEVEAQVAQIRYGYTMAKIKYQNDAGILIH